LLLEKRVVRLEMVQVIFYHYFFITTHNTN